MWANPVKTRIVLINTSCRPLLLALNGWHVFILGANKSRDSSVSGPCLANAQRFTICLLYNPDALVQPRCSHVFPNAHWAVRWDFMMRRWDRTLTPSMILLRTWAPLICKVTSGSLWWQAQTAVLPITSTLCRFSINASQTWFSFCLSVTSLSITFFPLGKVLPHWTLFYPLFNFHDSIDIPFLRHHWRPFQDSCSSSSLDLKSCLQTPWSTCQFELQLFKGIHYKVVSHFMPSA